MPALSLQPAWLWLSAHVFLHCVPWYKETCVSFIVLFLLVIMNYTSEWLEDLPQLLCSELDLALVSQSAVSKSGSPPEAPATTITEELLHVGFFAWASYTSSPVFHMCYDFELQPVVTGVRCSDDIASISSPVEPSMAIPCTLSMSFFL